MKRRCAGPAAVFQMPAASGRVVHPYGNPWQYTLSCVLVLRVPLRMAHTLTFPPVTDQLLAEAVRRILTVEAPLKVVLFGSHAKGTARADSDLDLLIIEESDLPRYGDRRGIGVCSSGCFPPKISLSGPLRRSRSGRPFPMPLFRLC